MPLGHVDIETDPCWKIDNYAQSDPKPGPGKTTKAIYSTSADEHKWQVLMNNKLEEEGFEPEVC